MNKKILFSKSRDCYYNLALEEYLVRHIDLTSTSILLIYINQDSVVLGKNQNIYKEVHLPVILDRRATLARRISGGGTVVHDLGNINFAFLENYDIKKVNNYDSSIGFMVRVLKSLGVDCYENERHAIFLANHKKISGSAQFSTKNGILSHFSLLYNSNLEKINAYIRPNQYDLKTKSSGSVRSEIANLKNSLTMSQEEFIAMIQSRYTNDKIEFSLSEEQVREVKSLAAQKYSNEDYIFDTGCNGTLIMDDVSIELERGIIKGLTGLNSAEAYIGKHLNYKDIPSSDALWTYLRR